MSVGSRSTPDIRQKADCRSSGKEMARDGIHWLGSVCSGLALSAEGCLVHEGEWVMGVGCRR